MNQILELLGGMIVFAFIFLGMSALMIFIIFFIYGEK